MDKIGIKFLDNLTYEDFESFQYLLDYDFEYDDLCEHIKEQKTIELDIEEDEDRAEDLEALAVLLAEFDRKAIKYELHSFSDKWEVKELSQLF
jgi:hypothetical protein